MALISQHDFETKNGQEKIAETIRALEHKVREMETRLQELSQKEAALERDREGYEKQE